MPLAIPHCGPARSLLLPLLTASLLLPTLCLAQSTDPVGGAQRSTWYQYYGDHPLTPFWGLHLEGQFRRTGLGQRAEQLLLRPGIDSDFGHGITTLIAYTYLRDYPFEGGSLDRNHPSTSGTQPEHRILEEFQLQQKLPGIRTGHITISHRFRAEQRFEGTSTIGIGTTAWNYAERARYRLTTEIPFRNPSGDLRPDYVSVYNEVFVNFGPHGGSHALDQDRTYAALGWRANPSLKLEIGYMFQYMPTPNGVVGERNQTFQVSLTSIAPFRRGIHKKH